MAKIDREGLERLQHLRNGLDAIYDKLDKMGKGTFDSVLSEFEFIVEILEEAKNDWERVE
jgi:hypothetical protein|tara:strand:- start:5985 stop:6164 length:180 start_codon:yes stop_codon:yes gene_type:complete